MRHAPYVGFGLAALFGVIGPAASRRMHPARATWLLSLGGAASALSGVTVLALLAAALVGQNPEVAEEGHWSIAVVRRTDPVRWPVAAISLLAVAACLLSVGWSTIRILRAARAARRAVAPLRAAGDLVVILDRAPDAYALPGRPGRVVMTSSMLTLLDAGQRAAVLAHERSHLRHHHHRHRTAVRIAAAMNPLLRPLVPAQVWATERWADEDATVTTSRCLTAAALTTVAGAGAEAVRRPLSALALRGDAVNLRVAALLAEPPGRWSWLLVPTVALVGLGIVATAVAARDTAVIFHAAAFVHRHVPR